jgi:hypothetical protein
LATAMKAQRATRRIRTLFIVREKKIEMNYYKEEKREKKIWFG